ncbi:MAG: ATPase [Planctomycetes bacterium]|jgi:MoxR-like ATPase|nr:ATPase [Planctomycetota bacterium]MDP6410084.1 AAA family ATPase [Planctomycetota bacterium]
MSTPTATASTSEDIERAGAWIRELEGSLAEVIVGQGGLVRGLILGLLTGGHVLLEGVPGLGKSLAVASLAKAVRGEFSRLQFTPDLLPSDLIGTEIYNIKEGTFSVRKGPVFANLVLADEVNRAPAKVQSALLEAMQERQVSIGGESFRLPRPFVVLATQNPIEQEGTYPLPEAQLDRFALKVVVDYPNRAEELAILDRCGRTDPATDVRSVVDLEQVLAAGRMVDSITLDPRLQEYIVSLVLATRDPAQAGLAELVGHIHYGGSPRATIWLSIISRAHAFLHGRGFVTPSDIKSVALEVLRHRVIPTYEAEAEGLDADALVARVVETVPVP